MKWRAIGLGVVALGHCACGGGDSSGGAGGAGGGDGGTTKPKDVIDIVADGNRDGVVNAADPADQNREGEWDKDVGASFIANLDDDDLDRIRDCEDEVVNGPADQADLATIQVTAWPTVAEGATGVVLLDPEAAENVRIFKKSADGVTWTLVLGSIGPCTLPTDCNYIIDHKLTPEETRAGATFGIEARRFKGMPMPSLAEGKKNVWNGFVELSYLVEAPGGAGRYATEENPDGFDRIKLRVAPWLLLGSMDPHDWMVSSSASPPLVGDNTTAAEAASVKYDQYNTSYNAAGGWGDIWTEDFFQTGWTGFPGPGGKVQSMRVFNARPWGRPPFNSPTKEQRLEYAPIRWLLGNPAKDRAPTHLGPDEASAAFYDPEHEGTGHTQDSHGAHDLIPPHEGYPNGRIITSTKTYQETKDFYAAQGVQGPPIIIDTTWLAVEHVDEFFHWVPAKTPRGWKLLVASPALMQTMLEDMKAKGNGSAVIHAGKGGFFEMTVDQALGNSQLAAWAQTSEVKIQGHIDTMKTETGLTDDEIVEIPTWFEDLGVNELVAWNPGMVNMRMLGNVASIPKPFGPLIAGNDPFEQDIIARLGSPVNQLGTDGQGLKVFFTDGWYYHAALGEVHCATNESAAAPFTTAMWWESGL